MFNVQAVIYEAVHGAVYWKSYKAVDRGIHEALFDAVPAGHNAATYDNISALVDEIIEDFEHE
jgi:hypothetical protein